jgi:protoporphyrinogen oxidase
LGDRYVPHVFEAGDRYGGIARTEEYKGFRFDIGGHRFFTKVPEVERMWHEVLGEDFITVRRLSRIYYRGKFFHYPLRLLPTLSALGLWESARIGLSYLRWQIRPHPRDDSFEGWVINRFGRRLYRHFFESYTQKVWGIPPRQIRADWAAQRIRNLSLYKAVRNAISGANDTASLIERFRYPRLGPGMMWERVRALIEAEGDEVCLGARVVRLRREGNRVTAIEVREDGPEGPRTTTVAADHVVSTMALRDLVECFDPPPPEEVRAAAARLRYRDFLIVTLVLDHPDPFPDNWIYIHSPEVRVGRIQNFRAWSAEMVPVPDHASIGMEYFCNMDDDLWTMPETGLRDLAARELARLGLARVEDVVDFAVIRQPKAYPVYDETYKAALGTVADWLGSLENFHTAGRNGLHRYNNQDHSMLTAMLVARNIAGETHDVWSVNVERAYHEDFQLSPERRKESAPAVV